MYTTKKETPVRLVDKSGLRFLGAIKDSEQQQGASPLTQCPPFLDMPIDSRAAHVEGFGNFRNSFMGFFHDHLVGDFFLALVV